MGKYGETIMKARNSRKIYFLFYLAIIALSIGVFYYLATGKEITKPMLWGMGIFLILGIKATEIHRLRNLYEIQKDGFVHTKGIINRLSKKRDLLSISDVEVSQNFFQRMLGYGTVYVIQFSKESAVKVGSINKPYEFANVLQKTMTQARSGNPYSKNKPTFNFN